MSFVVNWTCPITTHPPGPSSYLWQFGKNPSKNAYGSFMSAARFRRRILYFRIYALKSFLLIKIFITFGIRTCCERGWCEPMKTRPGVPVVPDRWKVSLKKKMESRAGQSGSVPDGPRAKDRFSGLFTKKKTAYRPRRSEIYKRNTKTTLIGLRLIRDRKKTGVL